VYRTRLPGGTRLVRRAPSAVTVLVVAFAIVAGMLRISPARPAAHPLRN
jgi:hypothetical protein